ncbi:MAG TPA: DUF485 domain-containing protein [Candidatus Angelobacter sp.]|nr:DUF485 domain-containing protein [Candidatus Angelobacter sp.]
MADSKTTPGATSATPASSAPSGDGASQWDRVAAMDEFKQLLKSKARFIVPATIFFIVYYFLLPWLVGYYPQKMDKRVWGSVNIAYLFALSQFFVSWLIAWLYVRAARKWDDSAKNILNRLKGGK